MHNHQAVLEFFLLAEGEVRSLDKKWLQEQIDGKESELGQE